MLAETLARPCFIRCVSRPWWGTVLLTALLLLPAPSRAHSTTVEHDLHIVHNVDNRSPEIDPFWYVGRGVRPIGRFGKRQSGATLRYPEVTSLQLLLGNLRKQAGLTRDYADWLPSD